MSSQHYYDGPVWHRFGGSRASYAVFPRVALCSMPVDWQQRFIALIEEAIERLPDGTFDGDYWVRMREGNRFAVDPLSNYRHHGPLPLKPDARTWVIDTSLPPVEDLRL